jgi:heme exporter protein D
VSSSYESSAEAAAYAREQAMRAGQQTRETFLQTMERHPLLVGGVGLALGALLASAIPSTAQEKRMFGETSEELQRRAREMASQGYQAARSAAGEFYDDTVRAAKEQGLSVDALREAADDLGNKMKAVAEKATGVVSSDKQSDAAGSAAAPKII